MTITSMMALFAAMAVLAAVPSVSVLVVSATSASYGFVHGAFTAMGIVVGDLLFILLAVFGLALLVDVMGSLFFWAKYVGGAYLIGLGVTLWRSRTGSKQVKEIGGLSLQSSFMTGLLITLGDQKAVLFYLGFLPAFIDVSAATYLEVWAVVAAAILAVGSVKLGYAYAAHRTGSFFGAQGGERMNTLAAGVMIATGVAVIVRA